MTIMHDKVTIRSAKLDLRISVVPLLRGWEVLPKFIPAPKTFPINDNVHNSLCNAFF